MYHVWKWWHPETRSVSYPEDGGGGSEAAPTDSGGAGGDSGASGGATVPASSPAPDGGGASSAAPSAVPAAAPQEFDWSALGSTDDLDHIEIPAVPPPVTPPQAAPVTPPQVAPAQQVPQAPPQAAVPEGTQAGEAGRAAGPLTAADPLGIASGIEANRDAIVAHLAQSKFALSEEDIKDLDTDVTVAVPKLLARVFLESQVSMQRFLAQAVPGMMQKYNKVTSANEGAEKKFFDSHKALDRNNPQHREAVVRMATVYRQANPGIPLDQLIQEVGPMVMAALRVSAVASAPPSSAARQHGGRSPPPFTPAVNGGGGLSPTTEPPNEWAGLGREYD
jgi:hypothetical protein